MPISPGDFATVIPFANDIPNYIYDQVFKKNFVQIVRDPEGQIKIPQFRFLDATFWTMAAIKQKEDPDFKWTDPLTPEIIDADEDGFTEELRFQSPFSMTLN